MVLADISEAKLGTQYTTSISAFKRTKNGRAAYFALKTQHAGPARWDQEIRTQNDFLLNRKWNGNSNQFTLEKFLSQHRAAYTMLEQCAENVTFQLPNERTRVKYLLDNIECKNPEVEAALASIRLDDNVGGLRVSFERAVAFLLPTDPIKKNGGGAKRPIANISSAGGGTGGGGGGKALKPLVGKSGVSLRYHKC